MAAIEDLSELADSMRQAAALLADEDVDESNSSSNNSRRPSTFLNVVALGNVVSLRFFVFCHLIRSRFAHCSVIPILQGAGKSATLNSLIGHPVLVTSTPSSLLNPSLLRK